MKQDFADIRQAIIRPPQWFDENGTPRYLPHHPDLCPDIYADEIALLLISCQSCGRQFPVQMSTSPIERAERHLMQSRFSDSIRFWRSMRGKTKAWYPLHYGDPPAHSCVGSTMDCEYIAVVQLWHRNEKHAWVRLPEYEVLLGAREVQP